ncbi:MAG: hypothetical protein N2327_00125 [Caldimicrobium sp.]|nr:hypothetical protein [Caldimicrobium sp.]MCX7872834.1 hypothetical protein [Caldimicrobium sp.]MDW8093587.1 hypothetical protein [Caldimicrobium sp.]
MKSWDEIAEALSREVKKEIAEEYFSQRIALEQGWLEYKDMLQGLTEKEKNLILNAKRLILMLENKDLIEEFEKITHFPLSKFYSPQFSESANLRKTLFKKLEKKPFGFTSKTKFIKLFIEIYQDLIDAYKSYKNALIGAEKFYANLKAETELFYKKHDLSQILAFIGRLEDKTPDIGAIEAKDKVYQELSSTMKISTFSKPSDLMEAYEEPLKIEKIYTDLKKLAQRAYESHRETSKDILKLVFKKD